MVSVVTLPQARAPLGYVEIAPGQRVPVSIDMEWMRAFSDILARLGGTSATDTADLAQSIDDLYAAPRLSDPAAQEATRAVDELRNELATTRNDLQAARSRIEQLEDRLA